MLTSVNIYLQHNLEVHHIFVTSFSFKLEIPFFFPTIYSSNIRSVILQLLMIIETAKIYDPPLFPFALSVLTSNFLFLYYLSIMKTKSLYNLSLY